MTDFAISALIRKRTDVAHLERRDPASCPPMPSQI